MLGISSPVLCRDPLSGFVWVTPFEESPDGFGELMVHIGIALDGESVAMIVGPPSDHGVEFYYHFSEMIPVAAFDGSPCFGEECFYILL